MQNFLLVAPFLSASYIIYVLLQLCTSDSTSHNNHCFVSVVVITSLSHREGPRFEPETKHILPFKVYAIFPKFYVKNVGGGRNKGSFDILSEIYNKW